MVEKCKYCDSFNLDKILVEHSNKTIHQKVTCRDCKKCSGFEQVVENKDFRMPFGKYKGKSITEIIGQDRKYAIWASEEIDSNNIRKRFKEGLLKTRKEPTLFDYDDEILVQDQDNPGDAQKDYLDE